jgi:hypothetical protein
LYRTTSTTTTTINFGFGIDSVDYIHNGNLFQMVYTLIL